MSKLREELIRAKNMADEERFQREKYESKLKDLEMKLNGIRCTGVAIEAKARPFCHKFLNTKYSSIHCVFRK